MLTLVVGWGTGRVGNVRGGFSPRTLKAVMLFGELLYGLLQVGTLLSLILQRPLPPPAVSLS